MKSKAKEIKPKQIRRAIIREVQKFQELAKQIKFEIPNSANLKTIINGSSSLKKLGELVKVISSQWSREDLELDKWFKQVEKLRKAYVRLIFKTGFITDEKTQQELDTIPLSLEKIIKEYNEHKI